MNKYLILISFAFLGVALIPNNCLGQDPETVFKKIDEYFNNDDAHHYDVVFKHFDEKSKIINGLSQKIEMKKLGKMVYCKMKNSTYVGNKNFNLNINHQQKIISVNKNNPDNQKQYNVLKISETLQSYDTIYFVGIKNNLRHYKMEKENSVYAVIDCFIELNSYRIKKMIYHTNDLVDSEISKIEIEVDYFDYNNSLVNESYFDTENYVSIKNDMVSPQKKYANYRILASEGLSKNK